MTLHPHLARDTIPIGNLPLSRVLLMNNRHFPWLILVPHGGNLRELFDLGANYDGVMQEVKIVSERFATHTKADKINIAALGNIVPQLHIHIIARYKTDAAWPNPVWNSGVEAVPYTQPETTEIITNIKKILGF